MRALERDLDQLKIKLLRLSRSVRRRRLKPVDFGLHLVSNEEMEKLRRSLRARKDFRGAEARKISREEMVNVLSFPEPEGFPHPETSKIWLGEIYLNRSFERRVPGALPFLMVHGFLHLSGYRHEGLRDTIKMEALEKKWCRTLRIRHGIEPARPSHQH